MGGHGVAGRRASRRVALPMERRNDADGAAPLGPHYYKSGHAQVALHSEQGTGEYPSYPPPPHHDPRPPHPPPTPSRLRPVVPRMEGEAIERRAAHGYRTRKASRDRYLL